MFVLNAMLHNSPAYSRKKIYTRKMDIKSDTLRYGNYYYFSEMNEFFYKILPSGQK